MRKHKTWLKLRDIIITSLVAAFYVFLVLSLFYVPVKCGLNYIGDMNVQENQIYGENLVLGKWSRSCIDGDSEGCYEFVHSLNSKSSMFEEGKMKDVVSLIEIDEYYSYLVIELKDWVSGETILTYPQKKHNWYEFYRSYDFYDSVGYILDENGKDSIGYELIVFRDKIVLTDESCDSRGIEEISQNIKGGCHFLDNYENNDDVWHFMSIELDDMSLLLEL